MCPRLPQLGRFCANFLEKYSPNCHFQPQKLVVDEETWPRHATTGFGADSEQSGNWKQKHPHEKIPTKHWACEFLQFRNKCRRKHRDVSAHSTSLRHSALVMSWHAVREVSGGITDMGKETNMEKRRLGHMTKPTWSLLCPCFKI